MMKYLVKAQVYRKTELLLHKGIQPKLCCVNFTPTVFPHIVSIHEKFPPLNSFRTFMYCDLCPYVL